MGEPVTTEMALPPVVLTIAGTDPCGGAGIQADLRAFQHLGAAGASVITTVIAQNSLGIQAVYPLPPRFVARQIDSVVKDMNVAAVKIGALANPRIVSTVANRLGRRHLSNVVLDPVMAAKDGTPLLSPKGVQRLRDELCPRVRVITPNVPEAAILSGRDVNNLDDAREAAKIIQSFGVGWVLIKGGHWKAETPAVDLLYDGESFTELTGNRQEGRSVRGTGCLFSAAMAVGLAKGWSVPETAAWAKEFVTTAIRTALAVGKGHLVWTGRV